MFSAKTITIIGDIAQRAAPVPCTARPVLRAAHDNVWHPVHRSPRSPSSPPGRHGWAQHAAPLHVFV